MNSNTGRLTQGQLIAAVGAAALFLSLFLTWDDAAGGSGWSTFSGMNIIMLLIALATLAYVGMTAVDAEIPSGSEWLLFLLGVLTVGWAFGWDLETPSAGVGAWLGLLAALAVAYGTSEATIRRVPVRVRSPRTARSRSSTPPSR